MTTKSEWIGLLVVLGVLFALFVIKLISVLIAYEIWEVSGVLGAVIAIVMMSVFLGCVIWKVVNNG